MVNKIFNEQNGLWYELQGDYYLPCLALRDEKKVEIGIWGQRHLRYLKEHRNVYYKLLTSGKFNSYLSDIDKKAKEQYELIVGRMKQSQGITEQLKVENALKWIGRMNNIRVCYGDCE